MGSSHISIMNIKLVITALIAVFNVSTVLAGKTVRNCKASSTSYAQKKCWEGFIEHTWPVISSNNFSKFPPSTRNCNDWINAENKVNFSTKPTLLEVAKKSWTIEMQTVHEACGKRVRCDARGKVRNYKFRMRTLGWY